MNYRQNAEQNKEERNDNSGNPTYNLSISYLI